MPRKPEPSFSLKLIIWDIAASAATDNFAAIYREIDHGLEKLRKKGELYEDMPDIRTVRRIIELDINHVPPEVVVAKLPQHVWHLRNDYEAISQLAEKSMKTEQEAQTKQPESAYSKFSVDHLSAIQDSMKRYIFTLSEHMQLESLYLPYEYLHTIDGDKMFPHVLEHCPSIKDKYEVIRTKREDYDRALALIRKELVVPLMDTMKGKIGQVSTDGKFSVREEPDIVADAFVSGYDPCMRGIIRPSSSPELTEQDIKKCQEHYQTIINAKPHLTTYREDALQALEAMDRAKQELFNTIDTSLKSSEYLDHTCRWCPH